MVIGGSWVSGDTCVLWSGGPPAVLRGETQAAIGTWNAVRNDLL